MQTTSVRDVKVHLRVNREMFPQKWYLPPINIKIAPLEEKERDRSLRLVRVAIEKYPLEFIKRNLTDVYFTKYLEFYGVQAGGSALDGGKTVYLANNGISDGYTDFFIESRFHSEFSSLFSWDFEHEFGNDWKALNPDGFSYSGLATDAIREKHDSIEYSDALMRLGFLREYSKASLEEDFCSYWESLFMGSKILWDGAKKYPRVEKKMNFVLRFLNSLNPSFTKEYFLRFSK